MVVGYFLRLKKWNLDSLEVWKYYCIDLRIDKEFSQTRQLGRAFIMTWGCFSFNGVESLAWLAHAQYQF